jgi:hypothetical protein
MSSSDSKQETQSSTELMQLYAMLDEAAKRAKMMKDALLVSKEIWRRLPTRIIAKAAEYLGHRDLCSIMMVCPTTQIPYILRNNLYRLYYERYFDITTAIHPRVAIHGAETSWEQRFKLMNQTERNWLSGGYKMTRWESTHRFHLCCYLRHLVNNWFKRMCANFGSELSQFDQASLNQ